MKNQHFSLQKAALYQGLIGEVTWKINFFKNNNGD